MPRLSPKRARGFTLVEILIVIAVVALLSALLFSAFQRVRASGNTATCASNLKQLGLSLQLYCADHRGLYPSGFTFTSSISCSWADDFYPWVKDTRIFWCPAMPNGEFRLGCPPSEVSGDLIYNWYGSYDMVQLRKVGKRRISEAQLRHPASTAVFVDGAGLYKSYDIRVYNQVILPGSEPETEENLLNFGSRLGNRHNEGANVAFADGHVKWLTFGAMREASLWHPD